MRWPWCRCHHCWRCRRSTNMSYGPHNDIPTTTLAETMFMMKLVKQANLCCVCRFVYSTADDVNWKTLELFGSLHRPFTHTCTHRTRRNIATSQLRSAKVLDSKRNVFISAVFFPLVVLSSEFIRTTRRLMMMMTTMATMATVSVVAISFISHMKRSLFAYEWVYYPKSSFDFMLVACKWIKLELKQTPKPPTDSKQYNPTGNVSLSLSLSFFRRIRHGRKRTLVLLWTSRCPSPNFHSKVIRSYT